MTLRQIMLGCGTVRPKKAKGRLTKHSPGNLMLTAALAVQRHADVLQHNEDMINRVPVSDSMCDWQQWQLALFHMLPA